MYASEKVTSFLNGVKENGLYLISLPTGTGKTKGVKDFIEGYEGKVIFIAHRKHLIRDIKGAFELKSDFDTVKENIGKINSKNFLYSLESFQKLKTALKHSEHDDRDKFHYFYINPLKREIKEIYKTGKNKKSIIKECAELFPSVEIEKYQKIITTSHKFISGFFHFENGSFLSDFFKDAFIFIDEFNYQKQVFLEMLGRSNTKFELIELYRGFKSCVDEGFLNKYEIKKEIIKDLKKKFKKNYPLYLKAEDFGFDIKKEKYILADGLLFESFYNDAVKFRKIRFAINSFLGVLKSIYARDMSEANCKYLSHVVTTKENSGNYGFVYDFLKNMSVTRPYYSTSGREDLYQNGFNLINIKREEIDLFESENFNKTPEAFIKKLSERNKIVGISATANLKTVVRNFDLDYLEVKDVLDKAEIDFENEAVIKKINYSNIEIDNLLIKDEIETKSEYLQERFKEFYGIYEWFLNSKSDSFLFLQSEYLDNNFEELIKKAVEYLNEKNSKEAEVFVLRTKEEYEEFLKNKKGRFFLISTYYTVGTGVNLQYEKNGKLKDLDGIYLGEITNVLPLDNKKTSVYYLLSMYFNYLISNKELKKSLKHLFTAEKPHLKIISQYKKTDDYVNAIMDFIIQAIGRLYRVSHKGKRYVFLHYKVFEYVKYFRYNGALLPVIKKMCEISKKEERKNDVKVNEFITNNKTAYNKINYLLSTLINTKDEYQEIREYIFKNPFTDTPKYRSFYAKCDGVYYFREFDDFREIEVSFEKKESFAEVSKESMRIDILNELFDFGISTKGEYMLVPVAFNNFFKGIVGEKVGIAVFKSFGIELEEMNDENYEWFDFKYGDYYLDFKNFSQKNIEEKEYGEEIEKYRKRLKKLGGKKAFIINAFGITPAHKKNEIQKFGDVYIVPYLIDFEKRSLNEKSVNFLKRIFNDYGNCD